MTESCIICNRLIQYEINGLCEDCIDKRVSVKTWLGETFNGLLVRSYPASNIAVIVIDGNVEATRFNLDTATIL
jgi:hypothetical protein